MGILRFLGRRTAFASTLKSCEEFGSPRPNAGEGLGVRGKSAMRPSGCRSTAGRLRRFLAKHSGCTAPSPLAPLRLTGARGTKVSIFSQLQEWGVRRIATLERDASMLVVSDC